MVASTDWHCPESIPRKKGMAVQPSVGEYVLGEVLPRPVLEKTYSICCLGSARV